LKNKGIQNLRGSGRGDQYVTVNVTVPTSLTSEQKELLIKFAESGGDIVDKKKKRRR
jgi:molecular chaperone DnaJ